MAWIYGASGHGKVILDIFECLGLPVNGFLDDNEELNSFSGYRVRRPGEVTDPAEKVIIAVGDNATRRKIAGSFHFNYLTLSHPGSVISKHSETGEGSVVMAGAIIQPGTHIGRHVIINTGARVDHDCRVGDFAHISPGAILCGNVTIGEGTWVGAGTTIIQGITVGKNVIIGAGSLIRKNVPDNVLVVGNPQRVLRKPAKRVPSAPPGATERLTHAR